MAHFVRLRSDLGWVNGPNVSGSDHQVIDQKAFRAWNGDGGGSYAPTTSNVIGGAGMWLCAPWILSGGGGLGGAISAIVLGDNDYPVLYSGHTGATRTIHSDLMEVFAPDGGWILGTAYADAITATTGANGIFPLRVHHGAQIVSVTVSFIVATHPAGTGSGVPAFLPKVRVCALEAATGIITPLKSGSLVDANGYLIYNPTPASYTVWNNAGAANTITYTLDAGIFADVGRYSYFFQVIDESGTNALAGTRWTDAAVVLNSIADLRFQ